VSKNDRSVGRAEIDNAPKFVDVMQGKVDDPKMRAAYDYWRAGFMFKWVMLPPGTPEPVLAAYRAAFVKLAKDPEFIQLGDQVMPGFSVVSPDEMVAAINKLEAIPDEALKTTDEFHKSQN
jgi:hypothetical protein